MDGVTLYPEIEKVVADLRVAYFFAKQREGRSWLIVRSFDNWIGLSGYYKLARLGRRKYVQAVCQAVLAGICGATCAPATRCNVSTKRMASAHSLSYHGR